ncbi:MAG TPA: RNA-binding protein, partial [Planctomycetaceae bacterium]|nr:RNA-binding protein [Planctomycetaceae bacterium]
GRFEDVTESAGLEEVGFGQGVAAGDIDGDGWPDLHVANIGGNRLYINNRDG